jgi:hypothetical protein
VHDVSDISKLTDTIYFFWTSSMVTALATRPINEDSYEASIKLGVSLPEDGSRAGFRNVVFFLNYTMDKAHKREILT